MTEHSPYTQTYYTGTLDDDGNEESVAGPYYREVCTCDNGETPYIWGVGEHRR